MVDELARRGGLDFGSAPADALIAKWRDRSLLLAKPMTFMNDSGQAVGELARYFKIEVRDLLIVVDEVQLPLGRSAGADWRVGRRAQRVEVGHRAPRRGVRPAAGRVGRGDSRRDLADHVLSRFESDEAVEVERMTARAADAAEMFITAGIAAGDERV